MTRVKPPLLTILSIASPEMKYSALKHVVLILQRAPRLFDAEYKSFFCGFSDPTYMKEVKVEVLELVAQRGNMHDIIAELSEYVRDVDVEFASRSIKAIAKIAIKIPEVSQHSLDRLLSFLQYEVDIISSTTILALKDLIRKYPAKANEIISELEVWVHKLDDPEPKAAIIWMLGEYGANTPNCPYIIEDVISKWSQINPTVKLQLLTCSLKVFFKRPAEMKPILGQLFVKATLDTNIDVHDRAYLYYRTLKAGKERNDFSSIEKIISSKKQPISSFAEDQAYELTDQLFEEFESLSVIYGKPAVRFLKTETPSETQQTQQSSTSAKIPVQLDTSLEDEEEVEDEEEGDEEEEEEEQQPQRSSQLTPERNSAPPKAEPLINLIDL